MDFFIAVNWNLNQVSWCVLLVILSITMHLLFTYLLCIHAIFLYFDQDLSFLYFWLHFQTLSPLNSWYFSSHSWIHREKKSFSWNWSRPPLIAYAAAQFAIFLSQACRFNYGWTVGLARPDQPVDTHLGHLLWPAAETGTRRPRSGSTVSDRNVKSVLRVWTLFVRRSVANYDDGPSHLCVFVFGVNGVCAVNHLYLPHQQATCLICPLTSQSDIRD